MPINFYFHVAIISSYPFLLVKGKKITNIISSYIHRQHRQQFSYLLTRRHTVPNITISRSDQPPNSTYTISLFDKTTPESRSSNSNTPWIHPINLLLVNISMHLNANTFVPCGKNPYPCTIPPYFPSFLSDMKQVHEDGRKQSRKKETEKGRKYGRKCGRKGASGVGGGSGCTV